MVGGGNYGYSFTISFIHETKSSTILIPCQSEACDGSTLFATEGFQIKTNAAKNRGIPPLLSNWLGIGSGNQTFGEELDFDVREVEQILINLTDKFDRLRS